jgi:hypothetical protein
VRGRDNRQGGRESASPSSARFDYSCARARLSLVNTEGRRAIGKRARRGRARKPPRSGGRTRPRGEGPGACAKPVPSRRAKSARGSATSSGVASRPSSVRESVATPRPRRAEPDDANSQGQEESQAAKYRRARRREQSRAGREPGREVPRARIVAPPGAEAEQPRAPAVKPPTYVRPPGPPAPVNPSHRLLSSIP